MSTVLQPTTTPLKPSQLSNTLAPARGPASGSMLAKSHAPPRAGAASTNSHPSSCSSSSSSESPKTSALSRSLPLTAASPSSSGIYAANAQSERVRIDLQRLEEAKRVESLRASFLSPPSSTHHTPTSKPNILVSTTSGSPRTGSSPADRDRDDSDGSDGSDGGSGGAPTCRSSSRGAGEGDQYRHSLSPVTASGGVGSTPISPAPPSSQQPSPDSVLASVLANMSLNAADSPSNSALPSTPAVPEASSPTAPAKSPKRRSFLSKLAGAMDGVAHSTSTSTSSRANLPVKEEVVAQTRVDASPTRTNPPPKAPRRATSKDDLTLLIINSGITELGMSIQEVNTIIFEIQELRHTTSTINPSTSPHGSSPSSSTGTFHPERSISNSLMSAGAGPIDNDEIYSHKAASLTTSISELDLDGSRTLAKVGATRTEASTLSEVDSALMRLQERLEALDKVGQLTRLSDEGMAVLTVELACPPQEHSELEAQISPFLDESGQPSGPAAFLAPKWSTTILQYEAVQKDAEMLSEELKEDKWLVVFRTVSSQAEDMMRSLEKVLTQSHQFVWDIERRRPSAAGTSSVSGSGAGATSSAILLSSSTSTPSRSVMSTFLSKSLPTATSPTVPKAYFGDPETMQPLLTSFIALHRSLHSKVKYYAPACDRVLKILGKGIADRSTKNGEVLRRFNEMKTRWRNLVERIARIEAEMQGVEEMLRDAAEPSSAAASPTSSASISRRPVSSDKRDSPLRKWANKVTGAGGSARHQTSTPPSRPPVSLRNSTNASLAGASVSSSRTPTTTSRASTSPITIPPPVASSSKPSVQTRRLSHSHSPNAPALPPASTPPRPPSSAFKSSRPESLLTPPLRVLNLEQPVAPSEHRRVSSSSHFGLELPQPHFASRRTHSPSMSVDGYPEKPRWNSSTKPADVNGRTRPQSRNGMAPRASSSMGIRPPSRLDSFARATSPTFSEASSAFTGARPGTPSRIPISKSRRSSINPASFPRPELPDDHTSCMQRVMSPAPSDGSTRAFLSRSTPAGRRLPSSSNLSPPPRVSSPTGSNYSSTSAMARRAFLQTPEPHLLAQASRLAYVRAPRPPPVPVVPRSVRRPSDSGHDAGASPARSSSRAGPTRPGSCLGRSVMAYEASVMSSDEDLDEDAAALAAVRYTANPLDTLDVTISNTINSLPIQLQVTRIDPPLTRAQLAQMEILQAKYLFALTKSQREARRRKAVVCKLIDRLGPRVGRGEKKVVVRAGTGWMDLDAFAMGILAQAV